MSQADYDGWTRVYGDIDFPVDNNREVAAAAKSGLNLVTFIIRDVDYNTLLVYSRDSIRGGKEEYLYWPEWVTLWKRESK